MLLHFPSNEHILLPPLPSPVRRVRLFFALVLLLVLLLGQMAPSTAEATVKASEAIAGSAVKEFKRESGTARLVGAGKI